VVKISEALEEFANKIFPNLKENMKIAQMGEDVTGFLFKSIILSIIFSINFSLIGSIILRKYGFFIVMIPLLIFFFVVSIIFSVSIPKLNVSKVRQEIESDVFIPSRMLLTLLESGNSLVTALEGVSYTKAKSSKYFGKIASEIYLGKNIDQAIDDAIRYTPSESFRQVLEPIKKSLKTGTSIQGNLLETLKELQKKKIIEIEKYEKSLSPLAMFYMIFGTIVPAMGVVGLTIVLSVMGVEVTFFPFLFVILLIVLGVQLLFIKLFKSIRPLVNL
jgi:hypothetical protein